MRILIVHDEAGEIRSVVQLRDNPELATDQPLAVVPGEGETVTEIPAEGNAVKLDPLEIHQNYRLDMARGRLVRKRRTTKRGESE